MYTPEKIAAALVCKISILKHQYIPPEDLPGLRADIDDLLTAADAAQIPWKLQNSLLYIGEKYDVRAWYIADLLRMACDRVGLPEVVRCVF